MPDPAGEYIRFFGAGTQKVEEELHKEVEVIEATKKALQQKISQAFEKLL